jgi:hypothetical protein
MLIEEDRQELEKRFKKDGGNPETFQPGSSGCHEALDRAFLLFEPVDERLVRHQAVFLNPEWHTLAQQAADSLFQLYQAIGAEHLKEGT